MLRGSLLAVITQLPSCEGTGCCCKILRISYKDKDNVINEEVRDKIQRAIGPHEDLLWYLTVSRSSGLAKPILQGTVKGEEDKADRRRGGKT